MHTLSNDFLTIRVSSVGGSIVDAYDVKGRAIFRPFRGDANNLNVLDTACFPLVPFCGRVADSQFQFNAEQYKLPVNSAEDFQYIHGDGWLANWDILEASAQSIVLRYVHGSHNSLYQYKVEQEVSLDADSIVLNLSVTNRGDSSLPFGIGFHPFFPRTENTSLQAKSESWWINNENKIPTNKELIPDVTNFTNKNDLPQALIDNCYQNWDGKAVIEWPEDEMKVELVADEVFNHFMLYTPTDSDFFCFEPMTHIPNGANHTVSS